MQTNTTLAHRIVAIDTVRGLVMLVMAIDHLRDMLHLPAVTQDPTNLSTTTAAVFLTRWITHLCAPTFVFLSGTSAYLSLRKRTEQGGTTTNAPARHFLFKRGLVLIGLELTLISFALWTDWQFRSLLLQVIFVIGIGLILLSWLAKLPIRWLAVAGLVIMFSHDVFTLAPPFVSTPARLLWALLFRTDVFPFSPHFMLLVGYPIIPWFGIMLLGFACGPLLSQAISFRKPRLLRLGGLSLSVFVLLRFLNLYGDPAPWAVQKTPLFTVLSFINVSKYPPSLLYAALMLGIMFLLLWLFDGVDNGLTRLLTVYGKVPLFYYLCHWYLIKLSMFIMIWAQGYSLRDMPIGPLNFGRPPGAGVSLGVMYLIWLVLIVLLYPACRWYARYKAAHPEVVWMRYV
ncbi:DUF1624 domain-containing protein [Fibrella sp. HMF5335]|uniref:DUF1624 domain-containing protein n=1 Tax=Fibrella rubiginis TaxID=2817060 RepID=A0A939K4L5_9BACT|nr:heparan-alpha-glucosaminide N-acetyltransferase domain-containing protein [Fibrella rubiginis]MBO0936311.1 DUF1624 domain-containing protein [Fibrella rubiginis]